MSQIEGYVGKLLLSIIIYQFNIDGDNIIDYVCFYFEDGTSFGITVDSSAEGLAVVPTREVAESSEKTAIKYDLIDIKLDFNYIKAVSEDISEDGDLKKIYIEMDNGSLGFSIGMDSINVARMNASVN